MPTGVHTAPKMGKRPNATTNSTHAKKPKNTTKMADDEPLNPQHTHDTQNTLQHTITPSEMHEILGTQQPRQQQQTKSSASVSTHAHNSPAYIRADRTAQTNNTAPNLYTSNDRSPFYVMLQQPKINEMSITRHMIKLNLMSDVDEVKKVAFNRVRVRCTNATSANNIIQCSSLHSQHEISAFIPNEYIKVTGIVKNVPLDFTMKEIEEHIESKEEIVSIERMTYWDKDAKIAKTGTSLKITFRATELPKQVILYYTIKHLEYFIPKPLVCKKCLRFGHIARSCRDPVTRCENCSKPTHASDTNCDGCEHCQKTCKTQCKNCPDNTSHRTNFMQCPEMKIQTKIKECMLKQRLSYTEAKNNFKSYITSATSFADTVRSANTTTHTSSSSSSSKPSPPSSSHIDTNNLTELNQQLIQRLKETEEILKAILIHQLNQQKSTPSKSQPTTNTINTEICNRIESHFTKHNITYPTPNHNPDPDSNEIHNMQTNKTSNTQIHARNIITNNNVLS